MTVQVEHMGVLVSIFIWPWPRSWKYHYWLWRIAGETSDLRLPFQLTPVPNYTAWWRRHAWVNDWPRVAAWEAERWPRVEPASCWSQVQLGNARSPTFRIFRVAVTSDDVRVVRWLHVGV